MQRPRLPLRFITAAFAAAVSTGAYAFEPLGYALDNGDVNGDHDRDLSDAIFLLSHLFAGSAAPVELARCGPFVPVVPNGDSNGDRELDVSDPVHLLAWLFTSGPEPANACALLGFDDIDPAGGGDSDAAGAGAGGNLRHVPRVAPPRSRAYGKTLAEWLELYWRWYFGGGSDTVGRVRFLPIPAGEYIEGDGTPASPALLRGEIDVHLAPGTPFVLPQFAWTRERYLPELGIPDDPAIPDDILLAGVTPLTLTINGRVVISDANEADFYVPSTLLDPIIEYAEPSSYGSIAAIAFQGCGFVSPPLPAGDHVIHLYEVYVIDALGFSFGVIYDNTWRIHVGR